MSLQGICNSAYFFDGCQVVTSFSDGACLHGINYQTNSEGVIIMKNYFIITTCNSQMCLNMLKHMGDCLDVLM